MSEGSPATDNTPKRKGSPWVAFFAIAAVGLAVYSCGRNASQDATPQAVITRPNGDTIDQFLAQVMCEAEVKERLVSPSTARFQRPTWVRSSNRWKVELAVDSENVFSAKVRSEWVCIVDGTEDTITVTQSR